MYLLVCLRCNYKSSCSFQVDELIKPNVLSCDSGLFMYFEVQFDCYSYKSKFFNQFSNGLLKFLVVILV